MLFKFIRKKYIIKPMKQNSFPSDKWSIFFSWVHLYLERIMSSIVPMLVSADKLYFSYNILSKKEDYLIFSQSKIVQGIFIMHVERLMKFEEVTLILTPWRGLTNIYYYLTWPSIQIKMRVLVCLVTSNIINIYIYLTW